MESTKDSTIHASRSPAGGKCERGSDARGPGVVMSEHARVMVRCGSNNEEVEDLVAAQEIVELPGEKALGEAEGVNDRADEIQATHLAQLK